MNREVTECIFPAFKEIRDEALRMKSEEAMLAAMEAGGWDPRTIHLCPVTLNWEGCDVSWTEHVRDVAEMCLTGFEAVEKYYKRHGTAFKRDLVIAGALLHDIGKLTEFVLSDGKAVHGENFQLMRHPLSGAIIAAKAGLPDEAGASDRSPFLRGGKVLPDRRVGICTFDRYACIPLFCKGAEKNLRDLFRKRRKCVYDNGGG